MTEKNGMNKEEIYKKLEEIDNDDSKYESLSKKEKNMFYELLAERDIKWGNLKGAANNYGNANMEDKRKELLIKLGDEMMETRHFDLAIQNYEEAGLNKSNNIKELNKIYWAYRKANDNKGEEKIMIRMGKVGDKNNKSNALEKTVNIVAICAAFLFSIILLSSNITGNAILGASVKSSSIVGGGLFLVGLVASFMYVKRK
jgi:hypothetical protein